MSGRWSRWAMKWCSISGDYEDLFDKALVRFEWDTLEADVTRRREAGEYVGLGLAMFVEKSGLGPTDGARINVHTNGEVEVITGGASVGQGFETVIAQVAPRCLVSIIERIRVVHGRTDRIEYGIGAHATRATVMTANATSRRRREGTRQGARYGRATPASKMSRSDHRKWMSFAD